MDKGHLHIDASYMRSLEYAGVLYVTWQLGRRPSSTDAGTSPRDAAARQALSQSLPDLSLRRWIMV